MGMDLDIVHWYFSSERAHVDQILPCPPLGHLCGSERPQHPTNPSMESELSRLSNRPGQCAVVFLPHSTTDFLGASSAPQWATYLCRLRNLDSLRTRLLKTPANAAPLLRPELIDQATRKSFRNSCAEF